MSRPLLFLLTVLLLGAACGRAKDGTGDAPPADTAVAPATPLVDSAAPAPATDAAPAAPAAPAVPAPTPLSAPPPGGAAKPAPYIGRDSAFGPTYEVDSTGKVTPIRVKKPVNR